MEWFELLRFIHVTALRMLGKLLLESEYVR